MKLSKAKAKKIGIEVWDYLAKHGEIKYKGDLPKKLFKKVKDMFANCPLCEYTYCDKCPLGRLAGNKSDCNYYDKWNDAESDKTRAKYAEIIRDKIKEW